jgi:hypothetical protein
MMFSKHLSRICRSMMNFSALLCLSTSCGCAYLENRTRDAADMITVAGEFPAAGVSASVGLIPIGAFVGEGHGFGLRSGAVGSYDFAEFLWTWAAFDKRLKPSQLDRARGKGYSMSVISNEYWHGGWFNWGQVEVAVGAGAGVRAGVNFCEMADFVVGLAGVDLCDDDIAGREGSSGREAK